MSQTGSIVLCGDLGSGLCPLSFVESAGDYELVILLPHTM